MKSSVPVRMTARLPLSGVPTILKMMTSITSETRNSTVVIGASFPTRAAAGESRAVPFLSSVPIAKTVIITVKIMSIIGRKLGER